MSAVHHYTSGTWEERSTAFAVAEIWPFTAYGIERPDWYFAALNAVCKVNREINPGLVQACRDAKIPYEAIAEIIVSYALAAMGGR